MAGKCIAVIGNTNLDVMLSDTSAIPAPGTEVIVPDIEIRLGGSAGNMALRCADLGHRTILVSRVGSDVPAGVMSSLLDQPGLTSVLVRDPLKASGITVAVESPGRDRSFLSSLGAMSELEAGDIPSRVLEADFVVIGGYFLLSKLRGDALSRLVTSTSSGTRTVLDTGYPPEGWTEAVQQEALRAVSTVDLFLPNEDELLGLTGSTDVQQAALQLAAEAGSLVVVKRGALGAGMASPDGRWMEASATPVEVVDSTGAGDGFNAAFLVSLSRGDSPETALRTAVVYATELVATPSALRPEVALPQNLAR